MAESLRDAAVALVHHGFRLIPLRGKRPTTVNGLKDWSDDPEMIGNYIDNHPGVNIGAVMGEGLVAIDVDRDDDLGYDGNESIRAWEREHGPLPETASFITGRGGYQMLYHVDRHVSPATNGELHIDIRGDGSYSVMPPSIHPDTKQPYIWENDLDDYGIAEADDNVYALLEHVRGHADGEYEKFELPDEVHEGEGRNNKLFQQGASFQALEWPDDAIVYGLRYINEHNFKPPLGDDERDKVINSVLRLSKGKSEAFKKEEDDLPLIHKLTPDNPPKLRDEIISGILREQSIMMLGGASKAGKTFMLMQLAIGLSTGTQWLGFDCKESKVLYVDLEVDQAESDNRFIKVMENVGLAQSELSKAVNNIDIINFRGRVVSMDQFIRQLNSSVDGPSYDVIILDPSYKIIDGDENLARDIKEFTNRLDEMARVNEAAIVYCHHHSKGAKGDVKSMDRVSGSGVFARHADAIVDCIELEVEDNLRLLHHLEDNTCLRLEFTTRSFKRPDDIETVFEWPCHRVMTGGELMDCKPASAASSGGKASGESRRQQKQDKMYDLYEYVLNRVANGDRVILTEAAKDLNMNRQTVTNYVKEMDELKLVKIGSTNTIELF